MANTFSFVFFLCLFCMALTSPVLLNRLSVQSKISDSDERLVERRERLRVGESDLSVNKVLLTDVFLPSVDVPRTKVLTRTKRAAIVLHECSEGYVWFANWCRTLEWVKKYKEMEEEE